ncbi:acetyl-CoA carboxylase biotin carboxyl carrier protein [Nocardia sp. NPDC052316]|uniref:Biotin carboxyl carrier protein of acetyl-CoA carboxylase n=1 Tax=Nocardia argentinensis TaxID=1311812 RepID=A0A3S7PZF8_9NOCA|nr:acetyl-CoA carboxylase biotin carboxyl carrier protein subunit [Nocardia argentinensis]
MTAASDDVRPASAVDNGRAGPPGSAEVAQLNDLLDHVRANALRLQAEFGVPPSVLRIRAGEVTVEAEWPQASAPDLGVAAHQHVSISTEGEEVVDSRHLVRAPSVGVFYRAPKPGAAPFVSVGDHVEPNTQVAIVEVMKLMIPVHAGVAGRVAEVLGPEGGPVEFDEPLFAIEPDVATA